VSWQGSSSRSPLSTNVILSRLLGICPCVGAPRTMRGVVRIGISTAVLMGLSALGAWAVDTAVLAPLTLGFLRTPVFVLLVAGLALFLERMASRIAPHASPRRGILPSGRRHQLRDPGRRPHRHAGRVQRDAEPRCGLAAGLGFLVVLALMTAIRERLEIENVPRALRVFLFP